MAEEHKGQAFTPELSNFRSLIETRMKQKITFVKKSQYPTKFLGSGLSFYSQQGPVIVMDENLPQGEFEDRCFHELAHFYWIDVLNPTFKGRVKMRKTPDLALNTNLFDLKNGIMDYFVDAASFSFRSEASKNRLSETYQRTIDTWLTLREDYKKRGIPFQELYSAQEVFRESGPQRIKEALMINCLFFAIFPFATEKQRTKISEIATESFGPEKAEELSKLSQQIKSQIERSKQDNFSAKYYEEALFAGANFLSYQEFFSVNQ